MLYKVYTAWNVLTFLGLCFLSISLMVFLNSTQPFVLQDILGLNTNLGKRAGSLGFVDEAVAMVLSPLWGALSDKIGTRPVATAAFVFAGLAFFIYTTASNFFPQLLLYRMFYAVGGSAGMSMVTAVLAEVSDFDLSLWFKRRRYLDNENGEHYSSLIQPEPELLLTERRNGKLSGLVGVSCGLGALGAVAFLLPLPTWIDRDDPVQALKSSYYVVGGLAMAGAVLMVIGLHRDPTKTIGWIFGRPRPTVSVFEEAAMNLNSDEHQMKYPELLRRGFVLMSQDRQIALGYIGGFIARAASIATTLFIPLTVQKLGVSGHDAYILAAILSGISNLFTLLLAPVWGISSDSVGRSPTLIVSSLCGIIGAVGFGSIHNAREPAAYVMAAFLGAGQIGAIVISMSFCTDVKREYSGAIAGVYSFFGGLGIMVMTAVGGYLADYHQGIPFYLLASFYVLLCCSTAWSAREQIRNSIALR